MVLQSKYKKAASARYKFVDRVPFRKPSKLTSLAVNGPELAARLQRPTVPKNERAEVLGWINQIIACSLRKRRLRKMDLTVSRRTKVSSCIA
jgi:hypothetical protein